VARKQISLVGDTFTHLTNGNFGYSVAGKISNYIEWVKDTSDLTFYVDGWVGEAFNDDRDTRKFAWLLESNQIIPHVISDVKSNPDKYLNEFELIFTHDQSLITINNKFKWVPAQGFWIKNPMIYDKSKLVSMISSNKRMCAGHIERLIWVEILKDRVDLFGRGFNEIGSKEEGLCEYMFSVAIENGIYETYFTEKILDCFATGTIPIYLGAPDIGKYFNPNGILSISEFDTIGEDLYYSKMDAIKENLAIAMSMEVVEDFIYKNYLDEICL
jgi:hypothetical protein